MAEFEELDAKMVAALERIASALERIDERLSRVIVDRVEPGNTHLRSSVLMTEQRGPR